VRRSALVLSAGLGLLLAGAALGAEPPTPAASSYALEPASSGGLERVDRMLQKLATHRRLLVIGAHPDDEDSEILAYVTRALGGDAAYLSLTRGEGGQNLVGPDLGVGLGLVRTQELGAARRLDGGRQFFTRAYDFGFTRSQEEAFQKWPREALFEDAVRVVRRFRPQVIVSIFAGTARDGHGQHQAAGVTAREAYRVAGDAKAFPGLAAEGLVPWKPKTLYQETGYWNDKDATTVVLATGEVDPLTGRSIYQIAMASRSLHRSQDMGQLQEPGPNQTMVGWVDGGAGRQGNDLFAGVDTRLEAIAAEVPDASRRATMEKHLHRASELAQETRRRLSAPALAAAVPPISEALRELQAARDLVRAEDGGTGALLDEKIAVAEAALAAAAEVTLDVLAERETTSPGESLAVTISVWNGGPQSVEVERAWLESPDGWTVGAEGAGRAVAAGKLEEWKSIAFPPADAEPTVPYFLRRPLRDALYDWTEARPPVRGEPFQPGPVRALVRVKIAGGSATLQREAAFRYRDRAIGEIRRPVRAVSELDVAVAPEQIVWPIGRRDERIEVTATAGAGKPVSGRIHIEPPSGWTRIEDKTFALEKRGENRFFDVSLAPPAAMPTGRFAFHVSGVLADGRTIGRGIRLIDYGYIPRTPMPLAADVAVTAADIRFPPISRLGYIRGAADTVPESLAAVGVPVEVLSPRELDGGDLSRFDAILVGSRAYETDPALPRDNNRLLDYVRAGGLVIVQYQQYPFIQGGYAPYPMEIARPHDRITDETATVTPLDPNHPVFTTPNRITEADWEGWVQERGLYFAHTWNDKYTPLLAMADPGGPELKGGLLLARLGKGRYVYTGLAFFRQLPAGVPGAYRLLANLLAWK
jgi:LmbE family N-acetylglucosaminyl deacetylase